MAPITLQRLVKQLDKLKPEADAARLKTHDYARRFARMIRKLRTRGLDAGRAAATAALVERSEEHTSELQSRRDLVCRLLLEKKKHTPKDHGRSELVLGHPGAREHRTHLSQGKPLNA